MSTGIDSEGREEWTWAASEKSPRPAAQYTASPAHSARAGTSRVAAQKAGPHSELRPAPGDRG